VFLANLSLAEFLVLAGGVSLLVTLLYLFDRTRRRQVVATLRFWKEAMAVAESRRWRIQQPLSLLLQLASILLLLLAVAQLRIGSSDDGSRDHVLILDTSAWMGARGANGTLMEEARAAALAYVRAVPSRDRVMIVRAGAVAVPATAFESDRAVLAEAIRSSEPGAAALNIRRALDFARRTLALHARRPGEIVFAGSDRVESDGEPLAAIPNFRYLPVETTVENVGLRRLGRIQRGSGGLSPPPLARGRGSGSHVSSPHQGRGHARGPAINCGRISGRRPRGAGDSRAASSPRGGLLVPAGVAAALAGRHSAGGGFLPGPRRVRREQGGYRRAGPVRAKIAAHGRRHLDSAPA